MENFDTMINLVNDASQLEIKEGFKTKKFIDSLILKEQYGVSYNPELSYSNELIEKFIILCRDINNLIKSGELKLISINTFVCLFVKLFIIKNGLVLDKDDLVANMCYNLDMNTTAEAKYVNQLIR